MLELALLGGHEMLVLRGCGGGRLLAFGQHAIARVQLLFEPLDCALAVGQRSFAARERLLEGARLLAPEMRLALGFHQKLVRFFLGFEEGLLAAGLRLALSVLDEALRLFFGAADRFGGDAFFVGDPPSEDGSGRDQSCDSGHDCIQRYR